MQQEIQAFLLVPKDSDFTIKNIPFGVVSKTDGNPFPATIIGDSVINLAKLEELGYFNGPLFSTLGSKVFDNGNLNKFVSLSRPYWKEARSQIQSLFSCGSQLENNQEVLSQVITPVQDTKNHLPITIGEYTDFYSSKNHAFNMGSIIRGPDNAMQPNWYYLPVGYHGRRSSIVIDGTDIRRPWGQVKAPTAEKPSFTKCKRLDYELEIGAVIGGASNNLGEPIKVNQAEDRVFGFVILNDWSARDVQVWEYVPLGPFGAKNFASTISPWIVTIEALEPHRIQLPEQDPEPFIYLKEKNHTSFDIRLEVLIGTEKSPELEHFTTSNFKYMYWSVNQQIAHHSITGCNIQPGDLFGSGTISGTTKDGRGCLMEYTWNGKEPLVLKSGEQRLFLEDGDVLEMRGYAGEGENRVGFGRCKGKIIPALDEDYFQS
ncbi:unnamed protein product [Paramecium pentaurelia]|uniref:Fumarylacetoacetase n=1 Tax=Paramecium pentaurelia TaxID=43138 RepID=A0A8S1VYY6_9CILI|nr:unnamed protein product [Paramecium pentaurelia]